jgi:surface antigen
VAFFIVAAVVLEVLVTVLGLLPVTAQAIAVAVATPLNFFGNKVWSFAVEAATAPAVQRRAGEPAIPVRKRRRTSSGLLLIFLLVFLADFTFGMWMNSRGFRFNDGLSRAVSALQVLWSADPHLAAVGFVWMPLPSLIELLWVSIFPVRPGVVASGLASTLTTALAGGATAAVLLYTCRRLGLPRRLGWTYALVVSAQPMLFLYATNGSSEGVAAPFLIGAVAFVTLFWHTGQRRWVAAAGIALALGFSTIYETVPYGAALFAALAGGILWGSETRRSAPQGRWRAVEGLGLSLLVPAVFVAILWLAANVVIMDDPLHFARSAYSNASQTAAQSAAEGAGGREAFQLAGDPVGTLSFVAVRTAPFLIPLLFVLFVRGLEGRFWRINTATLVLLCMSVPLGLIAPLVYQGASFGWLRLFIYPLFAVAGWGLYEISQSRRRGRASAVLLIGWLTAGLCSVPFIAHPRFGQEENTLVEGLITGHNGRQVGHQDLISQTQPLAHFLETGPFAGGDGVAIDGFRGWAIAAQTRPEHLRRLFLPSDRRFKAAIADPRNYGVSYFVVPDPSKIQIDAINDARPRLWAGREPGFRLVKDFPHIFDGFRVYAVEDSPPPRVQPYERVDVKQ